MRSLSEELQAKRKKYVTRSISNGNLNIAQYAKGATIIDIEGREWIDFGAAIGVLNVGHSHPKVVDAVKKQVDQFIHTGFNVMMYESYINLAEKLSQLIPVSYEASVGLFNTGAEAVENAVKMARKYTKRQAVVSFTRAFHGRTNLTMAMTSKVKPYKEGFGPFAGEVYQAPFPYMYRKPNNITDEEYIEQTIASFKDFFITTVAPEDVACIVMEPVQGEGGFIVPPKQFVQEVSAFCKNHGIVFIADEIQTGFARTGTLFAIEQYAVEPDLVLLSKSIAAGLPLSAVVGRKEIINAPESGELGGTFSGSPVACAAALAVLDIIEQETLTERAEEIGNQIEQKLQEFKRRFSFVGDIRRLGAMVAVELVQSRKSKKPDSNITRKIVKYANENGLLLLTAGTYNNVIRFLTPLVITDKELMKGFHILEEAFENVEKESMHVN
mgnify:CR=1 FL=1